MKAVVWVVGIVVVLAAAAWGGREYATRTMDRRALTPRVLGPASPADVNLPFSRVAVPSGDRTLIGWWVRAPGDSARTAPALLFFHGNRSAISDYVPLVRFLNRQGVSTLVFDYSGFGASGGEASLRNAVQDAAAMAKVFSDSAGSTARKVAMGSALGATILLQAVDSVQPHVSGLVIEGADASVRDAAVRAGHVPARVASTLPDPADNVAAAARVRVPVLLVHSRADSRVPFSEAERLLGAITARATLVKHWREGHSAILASSRFCDWAPVLAFVHHGTLPPVRVDSANVCEADVRQHAALADSARADSLRRDSARAAAAKASPRDTAGAKRTAPAGTKTKSPQAAPTGTRQPARPTGTKRP